LKKLLIYLVLLVVSVNSYAMSGAHAMQIYLKLLRDNDLDGVPLLIVKNRDVNAANTGYSIQVYTGMLNNVRNDSEMALVLGHEIAHGTLHHNGSTIPNEYAADALGAKYSTRAGYSVCVGANMLKRFGNRTSSSHPAGTDRYKRLGC
jgi:predicted Zn-dependent protease